ncbi:kinase-like domain-containing protein [Rhizophagus irregularis DAOM 181602=DAOM 197198]|nr:kinase-like domain-containing protein [Rhizophagus irregularis DAOM 181602=DAOM 197198]
MDPKENKRSLWESVNYDKYQKHVTISTIDSTTESSEEIDDKIVYMEDLEKRKQVYGICGECNEPAKWHEGYLNYWDIENQKWKRYSRKVALKSLDNSSCISTEFLNEIKTHLQIYLFDVIQCYGITQDPNTKDYMMVLEYCEEPVNSDVTETTLLSECFDCQLDELDLNEINQDEENNTE